MNHQQDRSPRHNLLERFEQQAAATPDATALLMGAQRYTYREVNERANQVGGALQALGMTPGALVGICMPRSPETVLAVFGVIKAGGAYVPIDPTYPAVRQRFMVEDSEVRIVLSDSAERGAALAESVATVLAMDDDSWQAHHATTNLNVPVAETDRLYVLYTSGSTGDPKGVCGSHRQMRHRLAWLQSAFPVGPEEVWCNKTTLHFVDASLEMFGALLQGCPLVIVSEETGANPDALIQVLADHGVTRLLLVVSHLRTLLLSQPRLGQRLPALNLWVVSGERLTQTLVHTFQEAAPSARLVNLYGCTEVPEISWVELRPELDLKDRDAPIGHAIAGSTVYVVDDALQAVAPGEVGELVVSSPLMSLGYLKRPQEDAARFVASPFVAGDRLYRTGDRVLQTSDGLLHYVGRLDHLVKIRGYRVELTEVETALTQADPAIKAGVVVVREDLQLAENKQLLAFVMPETVDVTQVTEILRKQLPVYMLPQQIIPLAQFPTTLSGKVDRQALLATVQPVTLPELAPNATPQQILTQLWQAVLNVEQVNLHDTFFEAGGDSLLAIVLRNQISQLLAVDIPVTAFLDQLNFERLVQVVQEHPSVVKPDKTPPVPVDVAISHGATEVQSPTHIEVRL